MDESSAASTLDGTTEHLGIVADHKDMCKFESKDALGFQTVGAVGAGYVAVAAKQELGAKGW